MIWTGHNAADALAFWSRTPHLHAMRLTRLGCGYALHIRARVGGWPNDPVTPRDYILVCHGVDLSKIL